MKKLFVFGISLFVMFSCMNQSKPPNDVKLAEMKALTVDDLQKQGKDLVGKEVVVKGTVTHVCKESGARCFVMGSTEDISIRIEAGKIGSFSQEQMGSEIHVRGILCEVQLDEEDLAEMEKSVAAGESANIGHALGSDASGMHSVAGDNKDSIIQAEKLAQMNQKLTESKEGYVPVYYLDGLEIVPAQD
jgi:hypothetical protein